MSSNSKHGKMGLDTDRRSMLGHGKTKSVHVSAAAGQLKRNCIVCEMLYLVIPLCKRYSRCVKVPLQITCPAESTGKLPAQSSSASQAPETASLVHVQRRLSTASAPGPMDMCISCLACWLPKKWAGMAQQAGKQCKPAGFMIYHARQPNKVSWESQMTPGAHRRTCSRCAPLRRRSQRDQVCQ